MKTFQVTLINGKLVNVKADDVHVTNQGAKFLKGKGSGAELVAFIAANQIVAIINQP